MAPLNGRTADDLWALEISLDVQWAHAIAPRANIIVVAAASEWVNDILAAVDFAVLHGASQVSMSFVTPEWNGDEQLDSHFTVPGVGFFASSGDGGSGVNWPAVSPGVTSVGGTSLQLGSDGKVLKELAWRDSAGGVSAYIGKPAYQAKPVQGANRSVPDVSYNADPDWGFSVYDSQGFGGTKGWIPVGGTSAGAPQWAAIMALVNSHRGSERPLSSVNEAIYLLGWPDSNETYYFRDITSGCDGPSTADCAHLGYDSVTGLGSPMIDRLIGALSSFVE